MPIVSANANQTPQGGSSNTLATLSGQTNTLLQALLLATTQVAGSLDPAPSIKTADPMLAADLITLAQTDKVNPPTQLQ